MASVIFFDKVGGTEELAATDGQPVLSVLRCAGIPANSVLVHKNGSIVCERTAVVEPGDYIEIRQVRHYDLGVIRQAKERVYSCPNPVYTKSVLFDEGGEVVVRREQLDVDTFLDYIETTFIESIAEADILLPEQPTIIGLSGGRDSVAFVKLLERTRDRLKSVPECAVTITGLPDWEEPGAIAAARRCADALGIEHVLVDGSDIEERFHLRKPFSEVMNQVVMGQSSGATMVFVHQVLRRMLEVEAEKRGSRRVAMGLNADDLVASLIEWFTTGFRMGPIPVRTIGDFTYTFPVHRITKKELTLYLQILDPVLTQQGAPGRFTTGPDERSLAYAIADQLYDLWPGIDYFLFEAFGNVQALSKPIETVRCMVCEATLVVQPITGPAPGLCDLCDYLARSELSSVR